MELLWVPGGGREEQKEETVIEEERERRDEVKWLVEAERETMDAVSAWNQTREEKVWVEGMHKEIKREGQGCRVMADCCQKQSLQPPVLLFTPVWHITEWRVNYEEQSSTSKHASFKESNSKDAWG